METIEIDDLTKDFYRAISFRNEKTPDLDEVRILFYGDGTLVNNSFHNPISFTIESFVAALESDIAEGDLSQFLQHELHSRTEVFGKVAHRISVYEYNLGEVTSGRLPRGVNYIQFILQDDAWRILSMAWCDENEENVIPGEYLQ